MMKIYVIWQYNPLTKSESIVGWSRDKAQAQISHTPSLQPERVEERLIPPGLLADLRRIRIHVLKDMLDNIPELTKTINADSKDVLLIRHDIVSSIEELENRANYENYIYDDEIVRYIDAVEKGVI